MVFFKVIDPAILSLFSNSLSQIVDPHHLKLNIIENSITIHTAAGYSLAVTLQQKSAPEYPGAVTNSLEHVFPTVRLSSKVHSFVVSSQAYPAFNNPEDTSTGSSRLGESSGKSYTAQFTRANNQTIENNSGTNNRRYQKFHKRNSNIVMHCWQLTITKPTKQKLPKPTTNEDK